MPQHPLWTKYQRLTSFLVDKTFFLAMLCLLGMIVPVTIDVILRAFTSWSLPGTVEMEELFMLMLVFLSLAEPQLKQRHIEMDLFFTHFSKPVQRGLMVLHWTICLILMLVLTYEVGAISLERFETKQFSEVLAIPHWPFFLVATLGMLLLCLALIDSLGTAVLDCLRNRNLPALAAALAGSGLLCSLPWLLEDTPLAWDYLLAGGCGFLLLMLLLIGRMPIGYAMAAVGVTGLMLIEENHLMPLYMLGMSAPHTAMSYTMSVIPLFIFMGELALYSNISKGLFDAAAKWFGCYPGGMAIASVAGCTGFAAICGDSLATAMTMSSVALPEMKSRGYNSGFACAALASGGTLGILIPPSVGFIMYAIVTEASLGKLFMAGIIPGLLLALLFCFSIYIMARLYPDMAPRGPRYSMREKLASLGGVLPMVGLVVFVMGGMLAGFFSPTEAGAIGAAGTLTYSLLSRRLSSKGFRTAVMSAVSMTTKLMLILIGVNLLGYFLAATQLPFLLADFILGITSNKWLIFVMVVLLYVALGCMLNVVPMILLTLPAIFPTIEALGFDPVWFGVVTVILMEMGQITPPMGLVVFALAGMPDGAPMASIFKYVIIFVLCMLALVTLLAIFPQIALFLPNMVI